MSLYKTPTLCFVLNQHVYLLVFPITENSRIAYFCIQNTTTPHPLFPDAGLPSGGTQKALLVWTSSKLCDRDCSGFQRKKEKSLSLCDPMDCSPPGSSVGGIFQARVLEWVSVSFSRGSSWPRDRTLISRIVGRRFTVWTTREVLGTGIKHGRLPV